MKQIRCILIVALLLCSTTAAVAAFTARGLQSSLHLVEGGICCAGKRTRISDGIKQTVTT